MTISHEGAKEGLRTVKKLAPEQVIAAFVKRLRDKEEEVARIASFWNGFEDWLKFELALELCARWGRRPWTDQSDEATALSIGVEYKAPLRATRGALRASKQVDLWVSAQDEERETWHFVELKVAFKNDNKGKPIASCLSDVEALRAIRDRQAAGRIALLVTVGFADEDLKKALPSVEPAWIHKGDPSRGADSTPSIALLGVVS